MSNYLSNIGVITVHELNNNYITHSLSCEQVEGSDIPMALSKTAVSPLLTHWSTIVLH